MTIGELKKLIKKLPNDMDVVMELDEDTYVSACRLKSQVIDAELLDEDEPPIQVFLIIGCDCELEQEEGELNSRPDLN